MVKISGPFLGAIRLQEKIFGPLKMRHTTSYVSKARSAKKAIARPYLFSADTGTVIRSPLETGYACTAPVVSTQVPFADAHKGRWSETLSVGEDAGAVGGNVP